MDFDVREELEPYFHKFDRMTDKGTHLNSCSPFRRDSVPSFYVYVEDTHTAKAGYWGDHAADDSEFERGTFLKLFAFLRDESEEMAFQYLNEKYGTMAPADVDRLKLRPNRRMTIQPPRETLCADEYEQTHRADVSAAYAYLGGRRIDPAVMETARIGEWGSAVAIPWFNARGELLTVKYRDMTVKKFWYVTGGVDITGELYGIDSVYRNRPKRVHIVEAEIDRLYLESLGYAAVALGNKAMNRKRAELLRRAPYSEICIVPDNDTPGMHSAELTYEFMRGHRPIFIAIPPEPYKDVNQMQPDEVRELLDHAEQFAPLESAIANNFEDDE